MNSKRTILLVEDDDSVRAFVLGALRRLGYEVLAAAAGEEALRLSREWPGPIDLLVTDLVMPVIGGRELAWRLTTTRPGLRVLFMSGYTDAEHVSEGMDVGPVGLLKKPFSISELRGAVEEQIRRVA